MLRTLIARCGDAHLLLPLQLSVLLGLDELQHALRSGTLARGGNVRQLNIISTHVCLSTEETAWRALRHHPKTEIISMNLLTVPASLTHPLPQVRATHSELRVTLGHVQIHAFHGQREVSVDVELHALAHSYAHAQQHEQQL